MPYRRVRRQRGRKRKRWYASAQIGKNVPFIGGTGFRIGTTRRVAKIARAIVNKDRETKQYPFSFNQGGLLENTVYTSAPVQFITEGTDDNQRIGKKIFLRHLNLKGQIYGSYPVYFVRVMVYWSPTETTITGTYPTLSNVSVGTTQLFTPTVGAYAFAHLNNKLGNKMLCDRVYKVDSETSGTPDERKFRIDCPIFRNIQYANNAAPSLLHGDQLYVSVIVHQINVSGGSATSVGIVCNGIVTYKDS